MNKFNYKPIDVDEESVKDKLDQMDDYQKDVLLLSSIIEMCKDKFIDYDKMLATLGIGYEVIRGNLQITEFTEGEEIDG